MSQEEGNTGQNEVEIVRGRVGSVALYEITEYEFKVLERGSPNSAFLNFSIFLVSVGLSFLTALLSTDIQSDRTFIVFVVLSSVGIVLGIFFLGLWFRGKNEVTDVAERIRKRIAAPEEADTEVQES